MEYLKRVTLDVNAFNNYRFVQAKQGDKVLRKLAISITEDGLPITPTGVGHVEFRCSKPDGNAVILSSEDGYITAAAGVYTVSLTEQCLAVAGQCISDLAFFDDSNNVVSSCTFVLDVIPMPDIGSMVESSTEWLRLSRAIEEAESIVGSNILFRMNGTNLQYSSNGGTTWTDLTSFAYITDTQIDALF